MLAVCIKLKVAYSIAMLQFIKIDKAQPISFRNLFNTIEKEGKVQILVSHQRLL